MKRAASVLWVAVWLTSAAQADVPSLAKQLKSKDPDERRQAAQSLGREDAKEKGVVEALQLALKDEDVFVRRFAAQSLGQLGSDAKGAVAALTSALRDKEKRVVEAAADSLGKMGANGVRPLIDVAKDKSKDAAIRQHAIEALGQIGVAAKDAVPALISLLKDRDCQVQAVAALAAMGPAAKEAEKALQEMAADRQIRGNFKMSINQALRRIKG